MFLSLIGMSGSGKSFWAKKLSHLGFKVICCDEMIARLLWPKLKNFNKITLKMANWMGMPFSLKYLEAEKKYLNLEHEVIDRICSELETKKFNNSRIVIDTSGSLIYLEKKLLKRFCNLTLLIHLGIAKEKFNDQFNLFIKDPKPVIWKGLYIPKKNESKYETLSRCYRKLIEFRLNKYIKISDCSINYSFHHNEKVNPESFLKKIEPFTKKKFRKIF